MYQTFPIGWVEVDPVGIPSDAGTPEDELESTKKPIKHRTEIKRWVRGSRHVRICEVKPDKDSDVRFYVHYGIGDKDGWQYNEEELTSAEEKAVSLMKIGGYP